MPEATVAASAPSIPASVRPSWLLLRRPLLLAFVLGCAVSILAAGRLTPRLIVDGALSLAFVPLCEIAAFAVVYRTGRRPLAFAPAVDAFFAGNTAWLWWQWSIMAVTLLTAPTRRGGLLATMLVTALAPVAISALLDFRFSRDVLGRGARRAAGDVILQRAIAWPAAFACFLGVATPARDFLHFFVEAGQEVSSWVGRLW